MSHEPYDPKISNSLLRAVHKGKVKEARKLLDSYGISYAPEWSDGYYLLLDATKSKYERTNMVKLLLKKKAKVNNDVNNEKTPLHCAVNKNSLEMVKMLIDKGANVNAKDKDGNTPLHIASKIEKESTIFDMLLSRSSNPDATNLNGETPLHTATMAGTLEMVEKLLNHGADISLPTSLHNASWYFFKAELTALHFAVKRNDETMVKFLLARKANVNAATKCGWTPLHAAAKKGNLQIAKELIYHGASIDCVCVSKQAKGFTPLHIAAEAGNKKLVRLLLKHGAQVDVHEKDGETILYVAVKKRCSSIVRDILKHCPDMKIQGNRKSLIATSHRSCGNRNIAETLLQYCETIASEQANNPELMHAAVKMGYLNIVEDLLNYGTDVNILNSWKSYEDYTPLHTAVASNQEEVSKLLIVYGANINAKNKDQKAPIFYAVKNRNVKLIQLLLEYGADLKNNAEVLNKAVALEYKEIVEILLQHDVDVNAYDKYGITALHCTILRHNFSDIAKLLLSKGANVNAKSKTGMTTLHVAASRGFSETVQALLEYNADVNCVKEERIQTATRQASIAFESTWLFDDTCVNFTPLHDACYRGHEKVVEILLKHGAVVSPRGEKGLTPLHLATIKKFENIVKILLTFSADVVAKDCNYRTPLHYASDRGNEKIVESLLKHGAEASPRDEIGLTPLHIAAKNGFENIVKILLTFSPDVDAMDWIGRTALHYTSERGNGKIVEMLLQHGAEVSSKDKELAKTPLHFAAEGGFRKIVELLLTFSSDIDSRDAEGRTALHIAVMERYINVITALLRNGADINIFCKNKYSPFTYYACRKSFLPWHNRRHTVATILNILRQHIVKLKTAGFYVHEENLQYLDGRRIIPSSVYEAELETMKNEKINNGRISFYDILTNSTNQVANYARNESISEALKYDDYKEKFPEYAGILKAQIRKGLERKQLMQQGAILFDSFIESLPPLPLHCSENILNHLNLEDLRFFVDACKSLNSQNTVLYAAKN